jgi:hypothetical protein
VPSKKALLVMSKAQEIIADIRATAVDSMIQHQLDDITFCCVGYAESGYDSKSNVIAFGNWNDAIDYVNQERKVLDDSMSKLSKRLEELKIEMEWSDEWTTCDKCGKAVRTNGDSHGWQRAYDTIENEMVCHECITKNKASIKNYLQYLENKHTKAVTINVNPEDHGYNKVDREFENGWYGGQDDDPESIANALREQNITRFVFSIDSVGQFDLHFTVYIHRSEWKKFKEQNFTPKKGVDPAEVMKAQLQSATYKSVSSKDFIEGRALQTT